MSEKELSAEEMREKIKALEEKNEEYLNGWKRAKADYLNFKKDSEKEKKNIIQFANAGLILELLPILNNFKTAFAHLPEDRKEDEWAAGIGHIKKQMVDFLGGMGVEEIKTVGEKFDPEFHEAVEKRKEEGKEEDIILEEKMPGYTLYGKTIMPAKVVVNG